MRRWFWLISALILVLSGLSDRAEARDVVKVDSAQMLTATLKKFPEGFPKGLTIELAPGAYGTVKLRGVKARAKAPLTLRSADPKNPARLSGLALHQVHYMTLANIVLDYTFSPGDPLHLRPFVIRDSAYVTIRDSLFDGDLVRGGGATDNGFAAAHGLNVRGSSDIRIENNEVRKFYRGFVFREVANLMVRNNNIHSLRSDGLNFAQVRDVVIENNHIHDFHRSVNSKDHADMIQFWTNKTTAPSQNITIHNNVLNSGHGWFSQSIFMRNEEVDNGRAGHEMFYRNIRITQNVVINAHLSGIRIGETNGLLIANNSVLRNARSEGKKKNPGLWTPQIRVKSSARNVQIRANVVAKIHGYEGQSSWRVRDNFLVQDRARGKPGFYDRVFRNPIQGDPRNLNSFRPLANGPLAGRALGSARLR